MPVISLPSFAKGEISPSLYGRVDTAMYKVALRTARNAIIHSYGGVSNRPGTLCVGPFKFHTAALQPRIFRFHLGTTDQYVLEFGDLYMRVVRNDAYVLNTATTITGATKANPVVVTATSHGLSNGDDVLINMTAGMVELNKRRFIVRNVTANTVELEDQITGVAVDGTDFTAYTTGGDIADLFEKVTPYVQADLPFLKMVQTGNTITITYVNYAPRDLTRTAHNDWTFEVNTYAPGIIAPTGGAISSTFDSNFQVFTEGGITVNYQITAISDTDGRFEESLPLTIAGTNGSDPPLNTLTWAAHSTADRFAVYRRDNGLYGLLGETELTEFEDKNLGTDLTISPPSARNPFSSLFPMASGYYQQRQMYGGTTTEPDKTWYSQVGLRLNMSISTPLQPADSITASLASQDVQEIRHYVPLGKDLMIMTNAAEWRVNSGPDSNFSQDTIKQDPETNWGSSHVAPIVIGKTIIFVEDGGARVRSLGFQLNVDGFDTNDLTVIANHLLAEKAADEFIILDWTFGQFPEPRIYMVRSDGKALTMTFDLEQQVIAWTTWDTLGAYFTCTSLRRSVNSVEDGIYFGVARKTALGNNANFLERLHTRKFADVRNGFFVDLGFKLDDAITITNITNADPAVFTAAAHGFSDGDEVEITEIEWVDEEATQFNNFRFTLANTTANTFELLKRSWGTGLGLDYDISTFLPGTKFNLVNDVTGDPRTVEFSTDGLKMFLLDDGSSTLILEFDLSDPYDIATAVNNSVSFDYSALTTIVRGMSFSGSDGTTLFLAGYDSDTAIIYELSLSTGFDLSTATNSGRSKDISETVDEIFDIDADSSGTRLYVATKERLVRDKVFQFSLVGSDISTLAIDKELNVEPFTTHLRSAFVRESGTQLFLLDAATGTLTFVHEFALATPYDIDTAVFKSSTTLSQVSCSKSIFIEPDTSSGLFDLAEAVYNSASVSVTGNTGGQDIEFRPNGLTLYKTSGSSDKNIIQFTLSTAWDITTATSASLTLDTSGSISLATGLSFRPTGARAFILDAGTADIEQWNFSTPWDISTGTASGTTFSVSSQDSAPRDLYVRPNGTRMWVVGTTNDKIYQYSLSTAWDLSTASYDSGSDLDISGQDSLPEGLHISSNGTKLFIVGDSNDTVYQYTMSTAYDLSTASYDSVSFDLGTKVESIFSVRGGFFHPNGEKLFILDNFTQKVYEIDVGSTSEPIDRKMFISGGCTSPAVWSFDLTQTTGDEGISNAFVYNRGGEARKLVSQVSDLWCLEGLEAKLFFDGNVEPNQTVVNGIVTVADARKIARAAVGLPYTCDIELLDIEVGTKPQTLQGKLKKITKVTVRFHKSRMPQIGPRSDLLTQMRPREFEKFGEASALISGDAVVAIKPSWNTNGRLFFRQSDPVPLTILAVFPDIVGEDELE